MKLLINATNIKKGGGIQASNAIIKGLLLSDIELCLLISQPLYSGLKPLLKNTNFEFHVINTGGFIDFYFNKKTQIKRIERRFNPDLVYTLFGPTLYIPDVIHIMGLANAWIYKKKFHPFLKKHRTFKSTVNNTFRRYYSKKADYIFTETFLAKNCISDNLGYIKSSIFVIGNSYNGVFNTFTFNLQDDFESNINVLILSANYVHKNLPIICSLAEYCVLREDYRFKFILTLPQHHYKELIDDVSVEAIKLIHNLGPVELNDLPKIYQSSHISLLPTLLETMTAVYPESMVSKTPILTSNLDFARDICGDSALYFDPLDVKDIYEKLNLVSRDSELRKTMVENGIKQLEMIGKPEDRNIKIFTVLNDIVKLK